MSILVSVSDVSSILEKNVDHVQMTLTRCNLEGSDLRDGWEGKVMEEMEGEG